MGFYQHSTKNITFINIQQKILHLYHRHQWYTENVTGIAISWMIELTREYHWLTNFILKGSM
jgi:hypothetical protein